MSFRVELCSLLRKYVHDYDPAKGTEVNIGAGQRVEQAIRELDIPPEEVGVIVVNRKVVGPDYVLKHGDTVGLFSVLVGG